MPDPNELADVLLRVTLGAEMRDRASNFSGVAVAVTHHLGGEVQVCLQPTIAGDDGKLPPEEWFFMSRLEILAQA